MITGARQDVLDFYSGLQFNEMSDSEAAAQKIKKINAVEQIYPDTSELIYADSILEMGCGMVWLANSIS